MSAPPAPVRDAGLPTASRTPLTRPQMLDFAAQRLGCARTALAEQESANSTVTISGCGRAVSFAGGFLAMEWDRWPGDAGPRGD